MARRSFADIMSGGLSGAGSGAMIGGKVGNVPGAIWGGAIGGLLGGVGGYFAGQQDQPYEKLQMQLGMAQLDALEEENKMKKKRERMKRMFGSRVGKAYRAATRTMGAI